MAGEEFGIGRKEQGEIVFDAIADVARQHSPEVLNDRNTLRAISDIGEPHADPQILGSIEHAAQQLAKTFGVTPEEAMRLLAERAILKLGKKNE